MRYFGKKRGLHVAMESFRETARSFNDPCNPSFGGKQGGKDVPLHPPAGHVRMETPARRGYRKYVINKLVYFLSRQSSKTLTITRGA